MDSRAPRNAGVAHGARRAAARGATLIAFVLALTVVAFPPPALAATGWTWPVSGEVITSYSNGDDPYAGGKHRGIDIAAAPGTPVAAAAQGTVRFAGVAGSSGLTVSVRTADGRFDTSYLHLSAMQVRKGDHVGLGKRIGAVGTSGRRSTSAPHLHFGVRDAGTRHAYHDPLGLLPPPGTPPVRERPRGAPAPVGAPFRVAPAPEPVRTRSPFRARRRAPARRRVRVPAGRRIRVPVGGRAPVLRRGPLPFPAPVPVTVPRAAPGKAPRHVRSPSQGPARMPAPDAQPTRAPARAEHPRPSPHTTGGPDLGWALACAGLLLAAACLGRPDGRASWRERRRGGDASPGAEAEAPRGTRSRPWARRPRGSLATLLRVALPGRR